MNGLSVSDEAYNHAVKLQREGDLTGALTEYDRAIQLEGSNIAALHNRASLHAERQDWGRVITDCDRIISLEPYNCAAYNQRGNAYLAKAEFDKAIDDQSKAIVFEHDGLECFSFYWRGLAYLRLKEFHKAIVDFNQADGKHSLRKDLLLNRAIAYEAIGAPRAAAADRWQAEAQTIPVPPALTAIVNELIDGWCQRRALDALKRLLPAWPMKSEDSDAWRKLENALSQTRSGTRKSISDVEIPRLNEAIEIVQSVRIR